MGSNFGNAVEANTEDYSLQTTEGLPSIPEENEVKIDSEHEQGYLWMCIACENQPTFKTVQDLFSHKNTHTNVLSDINNRKNETSFNSSKSSSKMVLKSIDQKRKKFSSTVIVNNKNSNNEVVKTKNGKCRGSSPLSSTSSEDIPLANFISKKSKAFKRSKLKIRKTKVKSKYKTIRNSKEDKKDSSLSCEGNNIVGNNASQNSKIVKINEAANITEGGKFDKSEREGEFEVDKETLIDKDFQKKKHFCKICNSEFSSRLLLSAHKKTHLFENTGCYKCETCGKMCPKYDNFTRHLTIHLSNRVKSHQCSQCFASFYNLADLKRHLVLHSEVKPFKCEHCGEGFIRQDNLLIHAYKHTGVQYKKFACKDCDKVLNSPSALVMHAKTHSVKTVFCQEPGCKFSCYLQSQLRQHVRKHSGEKPFQCARCGRCFARSNDMKNHALNVHEGIKPFKCSSCPKKFALIGNLKIHKIIHTNERPYLCAQCGKSFNQSSTLRKHSIIMHNPWRTSNESNKCKKSESKKLGKQGSDPCTNINKSCESLKINDSNQIRSKSDNNEIEGKTLKKVLYISNEKHGDVSNVNVNCQSETQQISKLHIPQITVNLPISLDHAQTFILPTVILEPGIINN